MSERNGLGLDLNIRERIGNHKKAIVGTIGGLALVGGVAAAYINREYVTELFSDDKGAEVSGYLQAQGMKNFNFKLPRDASQIEVICPDTDIFSDPLKLDVTEKSGNITDVAVIVPTAETISYAGADGEQIHTITEEQDPLRFNLNTENGQTELEEFVSVTERCNP